MDERKRPSKGDWSSCCSENEHVVRSLVAVHMYRWVCDVCGEVVGDSSFDHHPVLYRLDAD